MARETAAIKFMMLANRKLVSRKLCRESKPIYISRMVWWFAATTDTASRYIWRMMMCVHGAVGTLRVSSVTSNNGQLSHGLNNTRTSNY